MESWPTECTVERCTYGRAQIAMVLQWQLEAAPPLYSGDHQTYLTEHDKETDMSHHLPQNVKQQKNKCTQPKPNGFNTFNAHSQIDSTHSQPICFPTIKEYTGYPKAKD